MSMHRLDFNLPEFTRWSWVSDIARETWAPRFQRITRAWLELEWWSVVDGTRRCGVTMVSADRLVACAGHWARHGLVGIPLEVLSPRAAAAVYRPAEPPVYRVVIGRPGDARAFSEAWEAEDDRQMGVLLGYPPCCVDFSRTMADQGLSDPTWLMATGTVTPDGNGAIELTGPPETNILWRWIGIRAVPHLPCRFDCATSVRIGREFLAAGHRAGFGEEADWLLEILSWPAEWSALHGIAEIKTPLLKASTRTDATACRYTVRRHGTEYPPEGAQGIAFPYRLPRVTLTGARGFQRGLANPLAPPTEREPQGGLHEY